MNFEEVQITLERCPWSLERVAIRLSGLPKNERGAGRDIRQGDPNRKRKTARITHARVR